MNDYYSSLNSVINHCWSFSSANRICLYSLYIPGLFLFSLGCRAALISYLPVGDSVIPISAQIPGFGNLYQMPSVSLNPMIYLTPKSIFLSLSLIRVNVTTSEFTEYMVLSGCSFTMGSSVTESISSGIGVSSEGPSNTINGEFETHLLNSLRQYGVFIARDTCTESIKTDIPHTFCCKGLPFNCFNLSEIKSDNSFNSRSDRYILTASLFEIVSILISGIGFNGFVLSISVRIESLIIGLFSS